MERPKVAEPMEVFTRLFEGVWSGPETLHPSPWDPTGGPAFGTWVVRPSLDGFYLLVDYTEERGGRVVYRGHGVHGWDATLGCYLEYWFDSVGVIPRAPNHATLERGVYRYTSTGAAGTPNAFTYAFDGDVLRFTIEVQGPDGAFRPVHEGRYTRA